MGVSSAQWNSDPDGAFSIASTQAAATSSTWTTSHRLSPRPITQKRPGCFSRCTSSSRYQPPGPYTCDGRSTTHGSPDSASSASPSCLDCPYGVVTGSAVSSVSSSPLASPVTTVEVKTTFGDPLAAQASSSARVPSTLTARTREASRCDAISAARCSTASGAAVFTAAPRAALSVRSARTAVVASGALPGRRTSA